LALKNSHQKRLVNLKKPKYNSIASFFWWAGQVWAKMNSNRHLVHPVVPFIPVSFYTDPTPYSFAHTAICNNLEFKI
jgi:hypothetical protein